MDRNATANEIALAMEEGAVILGMGRIAFDAAAREVLDSAALRQEDLAI